LTPPALQQKISKLKESEQYAEYKGKYEDVAKAYEKEKDRLTKLYHLYEETEQEVNQLKKENQHWQNWYNSNKEVFNKLFATAPPTLVPGPKPIEQQTKTNKQQTTTQQTQQQTKEDTKQKKKGLFRK